MKNYRKKGTTPMRPYIPGESLDGCAACGSKRVSVSAEDTPGEGGMIAHNPDNPSDQWYIAKAYFEGHYEEAV